MVSFERLQSQPQASFTRQIIELEPIRIQTGIAHSFGQDVETFIGTMFLNVDQLEKQLDKEEFQEIGSMASFKVLEKQFQMFIKSRCIWMNNCLMTATTSQYTQLDDSRIPDTPIQHMESVKSRFDDKQKHKEEYNSWVNERQMQTTEGKVDTSNALDASLVDTESSGTALKEQDTSSRSGNDAHADDADIRPIYDEELNSEDKRTVNQCLLL
ncbi:hypothetical protein Tco_1447645 [Tanacetum coccineum]